MPLCYRSVLFSLVISGASIASAQIYRWVDEDGNVHYSDCPPKDCDYEEQAKAIEPTEAQRREAERIARETIRLAEDVPGSGSKPDADLGASASLQLPETVSSKYLRGKGAYWQVNFERGFRAAPSIALDVAEGARRDGVYIDAQFPNPGAGAPFHAGAQAVPGQSVILRGKLSPAYECGKRYLIHVRVYPSRRKLRVIDELVQPSVIAAELCELGDGATH